MAAAMPAPHSNFINIRQQTNAAALVLRTTRCCIARFVAYSLAQHNGCSGLAEAIACFVDLKAHLGFGPTTHTDGSFEVLLPRLLRKAWLECAAEHPAQPLVFMGTATSNSADAIAEEDGGEQLLDVEAARGALTAMIQKGGDVELLAPGARTAALSGASEGAVERALVASLRHAEFRLFRKVAQICTDSNNGGGSSGGGGMDSIGGGGGGNMCDEDSILDDDGDGFDVFADEALLEMGDAAQMMSPERAASDVGGGTATMKTIEKLAQAPPSLPPPPLMLLPRAGDASESVELELCSVWCFATTNPRCVVCANAMQQSLAKRPEVVIGGSRSEPFEIEGGSEASVVAARVRAENGRALRAREGGIDGGGAGAGEMSSSSSSSSSSSTAGPKQIQQKQKQPQERLGTYFGERPAQLQKRWQKKRR
jgi:hypothetical protein